MCSDGELIQRTGEGDRAAFDKLYRRYSRPVFGLRPEAARRPRPRRGRGAGDVRLDLALGAAPTSPSAGPGRRGSTASRGTRSSTAAAPATSRRPRLPTRPSTELGPDERAEQSWTQWQVHGALERLPEREREVIALAYWSDLSQSEVAAQLGIPLGTVKTRTRSALMHLAEILEGELE